MEGAGYVVRRSLHDPKNIRLAKKAIRMAFEAQQRGLGFSMVELLSTCPTNWGLTPLEALQWLEEHMVPVFPLGDFKVARPVAGIEIVSRRAMQTEIIIAGFGGQGVCLPGSCWLPGWTYAGPWTPASEVTWIPSYGLPEMRGGTANCTVII
jgi:hypothetical protein